MAYDIFHFTIDLNNCHEWFLFFSFRRFFFQFFFFHFIKITFPKKNVIIDPIIEIYVKDFKLKNGFFVLSLSPRARSGLWGPKTWKWKIEWIWHLFSYRWLSKISWMMFAILCLDTNNTCHLCQPLRGYL